MCKIINLRRGRQTGRGNYTQRKHFTISARFEHPNVIVHAYHGCAVTAGEEGSMESAGLRDNLSQTLFSNCQHNKRTLVDTPRLVINRPINQPYHPHTHTHTPP